MSTISHYDHTGTLVCHLIALARPAIARQSDHSRSHIYKTNRTLRNGTFRELPFCGLLYFTIAMAWLSTSIATF
jgi:hypothetical protein